MPPVVIELFALPELEYRVMPSLKNVITLPVECAPDEHIVIYVAQSSFAHRNARERIEAVALAVFEQFKRGVS